MTDVNHSSAFYTAVVVRRTRQLQTINFLPFRNGTRGAAVYIEQSLAVRWTLFKRYIYWTCKLSLRTMTSIVRRRCGVSVILAPFVNLPDANSSPIVAKLRQSYRWPQGDETRWLNFWRSRSKFKVKVQGRWGGMRSTERLSSLLKFY